MTPKCLVVPDVGGVLWVGLDGVVSNDLRLDDLETRPAIAALREGLAIAYPRAGEELVLLVLDSSGAERSRTVAALPEPMSDPDLLLAPPVEVAEGILIASTPHLFWLKRCRRMLAARYARRSRFVFFGW